MVSLCWRYLGKGPRNDGGLEFHIKRLEVPRRLADNNLARLGLLSHLIGTWQGSNGDGLNVIAVPDNGPNSNFGFSLRAQNFNETMTFVAGAPNVPNESSKAKDHDQFAQAIEYEQHVTDADGGAGLHDENGMFLRMTSISGEVANRKFSNFSDNPIVRQAVIPHGVSAVLVGTVTQTNGGFDPSVASSLPFFSGDAPDPNRTDSYVAPYESGLNGKFDKKEIRDPNLRLKSSLQRILGKSKIVSTITIDQDTIRGGGIASVPFFKSNGEFTIGTNGSITHHGDSSGANNPSGIGNPLFYQYLLDCNA